jgi:hypothetical protein
MAGTPTTPLETASSKRLEAPGVAGAGASAARAEEGKRRKRRERSEAVLRRSDMGAGRATRVPVASRERGAGDDQTWNGHVTVMSPPSSTQVQNGPNVTHAHDGAASHAGRDKHESVTELPPSLCGGP